MLRRTYASVLFSLGLCLAAVFPCITLAASVLERSPITQGHWWDPTRSGSGFDIITIGSNAQATWYTYDQAGRPIWYTANGVLGAAEPWALMKHRWTNGRHAAPEMVGSFRATVRNAESIDVDFTLGTGSGKLALKPFALSGVPNEVDHSGHYFDPANSGWGFTLVQQGDVLGGVLYTYDTNGAPTWYAGFDRGARDSVNFYSAAGSCPTCSYTGTTTQTVGRIEFDLANESDVQLRNRLAPAMASGISIDAKRLPQLSRPASTRPADRALANFPDATTLKAFLDNAILNVTAIISGVDFSPAPAAATFSTTNLQEAGVDEPDLMKTNGDYIFTFATNENGQRRPELRVARTDPVGGSLQVLGSVSLGDPTLSMSYAGLYSNANDLVAITGTQAYTYGPLGPWGTSSAWLSGSTNIEIFDTSGGSLPVSKWKAKIDGHVVASRRIGDRVYIVSRFVPSIAGFTYGARSGAAFDQNRQLVAATPLADLLPKARINGASPVPLVAVTDVNLPPLGARDPVADLLTVYAIDVPRRQISQSVAMLGSTEAIYASTSNLYVATTRYPVYLPTGALLPEPTLPTTDVTQISLAPDALRIVATGSVEGVLGYDPDKSAFRMGESAGRLRIVTSSSSIWLGGTKNRLTILEPSTVAPSLLKTVSYLPNAARPEPLGKPGEFLYATRFTGDRLYAVTFKKVDPLYIVDLANPADPKITGALELPGFSEYLHPLSDTLLLGFGKDTKPSGTAGDGNFAWYQGLQLTLFDVSNAGMPREIQRVILGKRGSGSALLYEHHAFSSLTRANGTTSIAFPARIHDGALPQYGYPNEDWAQYPFQESGLVRYTVTGSTPSARLVEERRLITNRAPIDAQSSYSDAAAAGGRSILFGDVSVYIGNGKFWRQDAAGNTTGPF
ncbi:hypothetical protein BWI17_17115 [Betaproteobacteria bacterium GR16-43]|nr:hypothetical protein BWI17_17115 [Betaproteobacteria bacterium GR16-43]